MLRSMTGFGAAQAEVEGVAYTVEIRSVNNRHFKLTAKLPEIWYGAETEIEKRIRREIRRGTVIINVRMRVPDERAAHRVNAGALRSYIEQLKMIEIGADPTMRVDLSLLLQLPGVCEPPPADEICHATRDGLMELITEALENLVQMRLHEGQALKDDLLANCDVVEANLATVQERSPKVVQDYQERLASRIQELTNAGRAEIDADALAREVAIFAERSDVAEEAARLTAHLAQFRETAHASGPAGRKLDFIAQEMLREANTIASKANDAEIARAVVEIKTAIDRIKEQLANAE